MDGNRFDSLTRSLGSGRSRRGVLKGLGAAALGAAGLSRLGAAEASKGGSPNTNCAQWCASVFGEDTPQDEACAGDAAHYIGMCYQCGPAAVNTGLTLCGTTCVDEQTDNNNCGTCGTVCVNPANGTSTCSAGVCGITCNSGYQLNATGDGCDLINPCASTCITVPEPECFWQQNFGDYCYVPYPAYTDQASCEAAGAYCNTSYHGACYKWSTSSC